MKVSIQFLTASVVFCMVVLCLVLCVRSCAVDMAQEESVLLIENRLSQLETLVDGLDDLCLQLKAQIQELSARMDALQASLTASPVSKNPAIAAKSLTGKQPVMQNETNNPGNKPQTGQIVYLNKTSRKYHFWEGCKFWGASQALKFEDLPEDAIPCKLCQLRKVFN